MATKIGILRCSNVANEVCCPSVGCFDALTKGEGQFARYRDRGGAEVVGVISCAGCPTNRAPEKILRQVRSLAACGAEAIHLSGCMMSFCPFKNKYQKIIKEALPRLEVVEGTHTAPEVVVQMFESFVSSVVAEPRRGMADFMTQMSQLPAPAPAAGVAAPAEAAV